MTTYTEGMIDAAMGVIVPGLAVDRTDMTKAIAAAFRVGGYEIVAQEIEGKAPPAKERKK